MDKKEKYIKLDDDFNDDLKFQWRDLFDMRMMLIYMYAFVLFIILLNGGVHQCIC